MLKRQTFVNRSEPGRPEPEQNTLWTSDSDVYLLSVVHGDYVAIGLKSGSFWSGLTSCAGEAVDGLRPFYGEVTLAQYDNRAAQTQGDGDD